MPFQSEKQRKYLWANEPEIARDWTDTYGSRIRKDSGGIMQGGVQNFLGQQPMVNAPKYWQSAPDHEMTELAYITPKEKDVLVEMDMYGTMRGKPNKGPSGIMSLNGWGSSDPGQNVAGADVSAGMDSSPDDSGWGGNASMGNTSKYNTAMTQRNLETLADRKDSSTVMPSSFHGRTYQSPQSGFSFNPLRFIGGAFGKVGRGIGTLMSGMGNKFNNWTSNMRGGMTQQQWEQARQERIGNKRIQNILGRQAPITEMTQRNLGNLGYTGEMPGIGSTGTSRAIDRDYMRDNNQRYDLDNFTGTGRFVDFDEAQMGVIPQGITQPPVSEYEGMWDNQEVAPSEVSMMQQYYNNIDRRNDNMASSIVPDASTLAQLIGITDQQKKEIEQQASIYGKVNAASDGTPAKLDATKQTEVFNHAKRFDDKGSTGFLGVGGREAEPMTRAEYNAYLEARGYI